MAKSTLVQDLQTVDPLVLSLTSMTAACAPCEERAAASLAASQAKLERERGAGQVQHLDGTVETGVIHDRTTLAADADTGTPTPSGRSWSGSLGSEGEMTGDGRLIEKDALRWENLPLPLRYVSSDVGAHDGAVVVGRILSITREGGQIMATGDFDGASPEGLEAIRQVESGLTNGVSMDLDDVSFEIRIAGDLMEDGGMMGLFFPEEGGEEMPVDDEGRVTVMEMNSDDEVQVTTSGRIRAATIVAIPAFATAKIELAGESSAPPAEGDDGPPKGDTPTVGELPNGDPCSCTDGDPNFDPDCDCSADDVDEELRALVAAAAPVDPPLAWFENPHFTAHTPIKVTKDGRVYGHIAQWGTCHISHTQNGQCVNPPHSASNYERFHYGALLTAEGSEIAVGHLTMDTRHAGDKLTPFGAVAHYEHTGNVAADVRAGEDTFGIWVAGALRSTLTPEQVRAFRSAPISGDWRRYGYDLELVAALAVNVPGFGVPRPQGLVAGGHMQSLVAAGMLAPRTVRRPGTAGALSADDLKYLKRLADGQRTSERDALRYRVNQAKVRSFAARRALTKV